MEHASDIPVLQVMKELAEISEVFSQDRFRQRSVEQTVEIPTISLAGEIIEMPVIRTQERRDRLRTHRTDVENHVIQEKINQMTKHAPRMHVVEKTVEEHFAGLAHWPRAFQQS